MVAGVYMHYTDITWWAVMVAVLNAIQPEAAAGAVFGGLFFWSLSPEIPIRTRVYLLVGSVGIGYGIALPAARSVDWAAWAWLFAGVGASLVHVLIVSMRAMVTTGSPLPPWLKDIVAIIPWRKGKGADNEQ